MSLIGTQGAYNVDTHITLESSCMLFCTREVPRHQLSVPEKVYTSPSSRRIRL